MVFYLWKPNVNFMEPANGIIWNPDPILFQIGTMAVRWYGLLFALGFVFGIIIMTRIFINEGINRNWIDSLFLYMVIGTVVGSRLGHVFFYDWAYYKENLDEILKIWHGGLASHGAAIAVPLMLWLWSRKYSKRSLLWVLDRMAVPTALGGALIRTGNLINSEIIGAPSSLPWAFTFVRVDNIPRHPSQIYEIIGYLTIFGIMMYFYWKTNMKDHLGKLFGWLMALVFGFRFLIEFFKADQVAFEQGMTLNMGQWLSILPFIVGLFFILRKPKKKAPSGA